MEFYVRDTGLEHCSWSFNDNSPRWKPPGHSWYAPTAILDPFPSYRHDLKLVEDMVAQMAEAAPLPWPVTFWVSDREDTSRANGWSNLEQIYDEEEKHAHVFLNGKRVPPHPAMTRYLVAHEWGHHVEWALNAPEDGQGNHQDERLIGTYSALRGLNAEHNHHGQGGNWHNAQAEIFACDFRLTQAVETEFWPHPGIKRIQPSDLSIKSWWSLNLERLKDGLV